MAPRWLDWSASSFELARSHDRCIVLFLSPFWSRWGRRMERDAWSDPDVVRLVESEYVGIRVDSDRRPDVADRYAPGSLPATAFLDPAGTLLYGAGFLDASELRRLLVQFNVGYQASKARLGDAVRERDGLIRQVLKGRYPRAGTLGPHVLERTLAALRESVDQANGGFGTGAKAPLPASLRVLLLGGEREALRKTLEAMTTRGFFDPAAGAFFTGTSDARWTQPSLERTAEGNAALARLLFDAGRALDQPSFIEAGRRAVEWIRTTLLDASTGGLAGASSPVEPGESTALDPTPLTDRNGRVAGAFLHAASVLKDDALAGLAEGVLDRLLAGMSEGAVPHCPGGPAWLLRDRVALGHALLDAAGRPGRTRYLAEAAKLGDRLMADFWSAEEHGLLDRKPGIDELGELSRKVSHLSETSEGARFLVRLAEGTGEARFRGEAERILAAQPDFTPDWGHYTAEFALAVDALLR